MAKRVRGSSRPGHRRPTERRPATGQAAAAAAPRASGLTAAEAARAAELEAQLLAEERAAEEARRRTRVRGFAGRDIAPGGSLATQAREQYAYVARDVKEIIRIALILFAILFGLWLLIDVAGVVTIA
jgi:hypothetical protein